MSGQVLSGYVAKLIRFACLRTLTFSKTCYILVSQMWFSNNLSNILSSLNRQRRVVLVGIVLFFILLYLWPSWLTVRRTTVNVDPLEICLEQKLSTFRGSLGQFDAVLSKPTSDEEEKPFLPFVGNGYIGAAVFGSNSLYIKYGRTLSLPVKYYPNVHLRVEGATASKEANVIDFKSGLVQKVQCISVATGLVSVVIQTYAHRTRPGDFIQDLRLENPTKSPVIYDVEQVGASDWRGSTTKTKPVTGKESREYLLTSGVIAIPGDSNTAMALSVATTTLPQTLTVNAKSILKKHMYMTVNYTETPLPTAEATAKLPIVSGAAETEIAVIMNIDNSMLKREHTTTWQKLWMTGFSISYSLAPGSLNGDKINATMYYVLSHLRMPLHEVNKEDLQSSELNKRLHLPDRCYNGHHTLQNSKMWTRIDSEESIIACVRTWLITLEKQGCASMLRAGADGALQGMLLSFGALRFQNEHLEFGTHPRDLHRDYFYHRINYGQDTHVNISVEVGDDNKAVLFVALDRNDKPYYACDAGCLDAPVKLSKKKVQFPVKLTEPLTPILYITADKEHMEGLKEVIHVKEIAEAPAHEHHVIALHKHGHHFGGLPMMFWVSISILIVIFHLFLFKLIINEYCHSSGGFPRVSSKYNL